MNIKAGSHIIATIVSIASVTSKSFLAIGAIILEHNTDDWPRLRRLGAQLLKAFIITKLSKSPKGRRKSPLAPGTC